MFHRRKQRLTGTAIREWREDMGWTATEAAEAMFMTERAWAYWERGERTPAPYVEHALNWLWVRYGPSAV
jgi:transcriptional regulator with XRE-family HTH domain